MHVSEGEFLGIGNVDATTYSRFPPFKAAVKKSGNMGPA